MASVAVSTRRYTSGTVTAYSLDPADLGGTADVIDLVASQNIFDADDYLPPTSPPAGLLFGYQANMYGLSFERPPLEDTIGTARVTYTLGERVEFFQVLTTGPTVMGDATVVLMPAPTLINGVTPLNQPGTDPITRLVIGWLDEHNFVLVSSATAAQYAAGRFATVTVVGGGAIQQSITVPRLGPLLTTEPGVYAAYLIDGNVLIPTIGPYGTALEVLYVIPVIRETRGMLCGLLLQGDDYVAMGEIFYGLLPAAPSPLRLSQRNDGLATSATPPRLAGLNGATSTQLRATPRLGESNTYS